MQQKWAAPAVILVSTTAAWISISARAADPQAPAVPAPPSAEASAQQSAWILAPGSQTQLDAGKVIIQSAYDSHQARVHVDAAIRVHAPAQTIWPLITRCESASLLIPGLRHCKELSSAPDGSSAVVEHDIKFAAMLPMVHSVYRADYHAPYRMDFHRIAGDMKDEVGTWLLKPSTDGQTTTIEYRIALQPGFFVPHSMVRRSLRKQLPAALLALRERAEHPPAPPLAAANARGRAAGAAAADASSPGPASSPVTSVSARQ